MQPSHSPTYGGSIITPNKYYLGIAAFTGIDIIYTAIGAFYGGGGAELNPLFAIYSDPKEFILSVVLIKTFVISGLILALIWLQEYERDHPFKFQRTLCLYANATYGFALFGILGLNILYQYGGI